MNSYIFTQMHKNLNASMDYRNIKHQCSSSAVWEDSLKKKKNNCVGVDDLLMV